jgi:hypothetical protein
MFRRLCNARVRGFMCNRKKVNTMKRIAITAAVAAVLATGAITPSLAQLIVQDGVVIQSPSSVSPSFSGDVCSSYDIYGRAEYRCY